MALLWKSLARKIVRISYFGFGRNFTRLPVSHENPSGREVAFEDLSHRGFDFGEFDYE